MNNQIMPGKKTPSLTISTLNNNEWSLEKNLNDKMTMIVFYRGLHCPICSDFLKLIETQLEEYEEANTNVIVVSMDSKQKALKSKEQWTLSKLNIAYELSEEKAREWGLYISKAIKEAESDIFCEPGLFIIKPDGTLYMVSTSNMPFARPDISSLPSKLTFAQKNNYPVRGDK